MDQSVPMIELNNGVKLPQLGFGTWRIEGNLATDATLSALNAGYRLIDTAKIYGNEPEVGAAVNQSGLNREEIFVTSKLWSDQHDYKDALRAYDESLERLGLDYLDMYLIHWPVPRQDKFKKAWRALEKLLDEKRVRAIGVCNFTPSQLDGLLEDANTVPAVNQIELHPRFTQVTTREYCAAKNIKVQSYSPLMRGNHELLSNLEPLAEKYGKTPSQLILRWHVQNNLLTIPKSANPQRQKENLAIFDFELTDDDMAHIDAQDKNQELVKGPN